MHSTISRRSFLKRTAGVGIGCLSGDEMLAQSGPRLMEPGQWTLHGEVFRYQGEPSGAWVQNFTSTVEPLDGDRWRIWTSLSVPNTEVKNIGFHTGTVDGDWKATWAVCSSGDPDPGAELAIGGMPEGAHPVQVVTLRLQDGRTRLYFWAHGKGLVRYLAADSIDDEARRFRVVNGLTPCLYHPGDRAVDGSAAVEAGLERFAKKKAAPVEGEPLAPARLISNDATNVYQLPDGSFEMYSVALMQVGKEDPRYAAQDNIPGLVRVIDRYTSADGLNWDDRRRVVIPEADDPADLQFYYLSVTHTDRGRVGLLGHYRLDTQSIDIEPCFSADGITWDRPIRKPWLPRAAPNEGVGSYLLHAPHAMVHRDGRWWLFYTGGNFSYNHKHSHGAPDRGILLASCESFWE